MKQPLLTNLNWSVTEFFKNSNIIFTISNSPYTSVAKEYANKVVDKFNLDIDCYVTTFYYKKGLTFKVNHKEITNA